MLAGISIKLKGRYPRVYSLIFILIFIIFLSILLTALIIYKSEQPVIFDRYSIRRFFAIIVLSLLVLMFFIGILNKVFAEYISLLVKNVSLLLISLVIAVIIAEVLIRFLNPLGICYWRENNKYFSDMLESEYLIYRHKPGMKKKYQEVYASFNSFGLRDHSFNKDKGKDEFRMLLLGDSITFGWGVDQSEIFPEKLEEVLSANNDNKIEVINSGVAGYNTYQEAQYFLRQGIYFKPDMVVLLFANNDFEIQSGINERGKSNNMIFDSINRVEWLFKGTMLAHLIKFKWKYHWFPAQETVVSMPQGSHAVAKYLREISVVCHELKIPFLVFVFQYDLNQYEKQIIDFVKRVGLENRFTVYSTHEFFSNEEIKKIRVSVVDSHPNSNGCKLLANGIYSKIKDSIEIKRYELNNHELERKSNELKDFRDKFTYSEFK